MSYRLTKAMEQDLRVIFSELGISTDSIQLYFLMLKTDKQNITQFAKQMQVSRPHIYKLVGELESRNIVSWISGGLQTCSPTDILQKIRDKEKRLTSLEQTYLSMLPALIEGHQQGNQASKIKVISTAEDFLALFFQILDEESETIKYFGSAADLFAFISWDTEREWIRKRLKRNIAMKALILPSEDTRTLQKSDKKELRETRVFLSEIPFVTSFHLYANKVVFWQPKAKNALLVEDEYIVQMMRSLYEFCWKAS